MPRLQIPGITPSGRRSRRGLISRVCPLANWRDAADDPRARARLLAWIRRELAANEAELAAMDARGDPGDGPEAA